MSENEKHAQIKNRINRLQRMLKKQEMDGALLVERIGIYYFSGTDQDAHLWIPMQGEPLLMVRKSVNRAVQDSPLSNVVQLNGFSHLPGLIQGHSGDIPGRIGLELDVLPFGFYRAYQKHFPETELLDIWPSIRKIRMVKSSYEIACLRRAAQMADRMYQKVPEFLMEPATENDLAAKVEFYYRSLGHPGVVPTRGFNQLPLYGHIMAGTNAALPSNSAGPTGGRGLGPFLSQSAGMDKIQRHQPIMVDYVASVEAYNADQTRIFSLGKLEKELVDAHEVMCRIQDQVARKGRPGAVAGDLYQLAVEMAEEAGLGRLFMGYPVPVPFVGHGVGLELNEWPVLGRGFDTILEAGMTVAVEPKVVFPDKGVVGIENTFVVTPTGMQRLNQFPDDIVVC